VYEVLKAEDTRPADVRVTLQSGTRPITVLLKSAEEASEAHGDIRSVNMKVSGADPNSQTEATFAVSLGKEEMEDCAWISASVQGMNTSERNLQIEPITRSMLLDADLEVFSHDRIYEEALELTGLIIRGTTRHDEGPRKMISGEPVSGAQRHHTRPPETRP
jgi:hypothetical protein